MDSSLIVSIIIAVVAIVPGVWALVNQANKDKAQTKLDMNKAANDAALNIIAPLQAEVARLQARILELEKALIDKTTEIGDLMQANIDKDAEVRTLKYRMVDMQSRLDTFEIKSKKKSKSTASDVEEGDDIQSRLEEAQKEDDARREEIKLHTQKSIEQITNGSLVNQTNSEEKKEE